MTPEMTEQVLGLTVNEVMAYAAVANVVLVLVLVAITFYYALHAKRQADTGREQVAASNRQAEIAQTTLDLLLKQREQQHQIDVSAVSFQLAAAIQMIEAWQTRLASDSYPQVPDVIDLRPTNFSGSITNADRVDGIVAGYMSAGLLYIAEAETNIRVMRSANPSLLQSWQQPRDKAAYNLNVARSKLGEARTRLIALTEGQQPSAMVKDDPTAKPSATNQVSKRDSTG
jgi:hypothetical protein